MIRKRPSPALAADVGALIQLEGLQVAASLLGVAAACADKVANGKKASRGVLRAIEKRLAELAP